RADRVSEDVKVGDADAFTAPDDFRPDDHVEERPWMFGDDEPVLVDVVVDAGYLDGARLAFGADATFAEQADGTAIATVPVVDAAAFRAEVLGFLDHVEVIRPATVRDEIIGFLHAIAENAG